MKYRGILASVLMMAMLFGGCSADTATAKRIAEYYESLTAWKSNVAMTVDLGDRTADFRLAWDVTNGESCITVLAPAEIAGLGIIVSADGQTVTYEDAAIALPCSDGTVAPMPTEALSAIHMFWKYGIRAAETMEKDGEQMLVRVDYQSADDTQKLSVTSWFDALALQPVRSEVFYDDVRVIACTFEDFVPQERHLQKKGNG